MDGARTERIPVKSECEGEGEPMAPIDYVCICMRVFLDDSTEEGRSNTGFAMPFHTLAIRKRVSGAVSVSSTM